MKSITGIHDMTDSILQQPSGLLTQLLAHQLEPTSANKPMLGEAEILFRVERFVEDVRTNPYLDLYEFRTLLILYLNAFNQVYDPSLAYCIRLKLFAWIKLEIDTLIHDQPYEALLGIEQYDLRCLQSLFTLGNELIQEEIKQRQQECEQDIVNLNNYINPLLIHYARLMVVRVDLKYRQVDQPWVTFNRFKEDMDQFRKIMGKGRGCFDNLHGSAWSMEQGDEDGHYHAHILLMYDANCHQEDVYKGMQVGQFWETITQGRGTYFNCNDPYYKSRLTRADCCALGIIRREDIDGQNKLRQAAQYLVKDKQHLRVKQSPNMKTFDHGQFKSKNRRGIEDTLAQIKQLARPNFGI